MIDMMKEARAYHFLIMFYPVHPVDFLSDNSTCGRAALLAQSPEHPVAKAWP